MERRDASLDQHATGGETAGSGGYGDVYTSPEDQHIRPTHPLVDHPSASEALGLPRARGLLGDAIAYPGGFHCICKPQNRKVWVVISRAGSHRLPNHSHALLSIVHCRSCNATGRSSAKFVNSLPDGYLDDDPNHPDNR